MKNCLWLPVVGYEGIYEVSSIGQVRTVERMGHHPKNKHGKSHKFKIKQMVKSMRLDKYGYFQISIMSKTMLVHRLVARAFVPGFFEGAQVNHKNLNKTDNRPENLEWVTSGQNTRHARSLKSWGAGENNAMAKLSAKKILAIRRMKEEGFSRKEISNKLKIPYGTIVNIVARRTWKHI